MAVKDSANRSAVVGGFAPIVACAGLCRTVQFLRHRKNSYISELSGAITGVYFEKPSKFLF